MMVNERITATLQLQTDFGYIKRSVGEDAAKLIETIACESRLKRRNAEIKELKWEDMKIQTTIGVGGYSRVYRALLNKSDHGYESYAIKCLNKGTMSDEEQFKAGALDLASEGEILARLFHENIIQLYGHYRGGPVNAFCDNEKGYFLVLELLQTTLKSKLEEFRRSVMKVRIKVLPGNSGVANRLRTIALGVARGLEYLHSQNIVLRDLKPENIGFDANGTPKLFDLGFAREVHTLKDLEYAGSLRYMAPEVTLGNGTSVKSDVYSFGILLWELITLEKPFKQFNGRAEFKEKVTLEGYRPGLSSIRSKSLQKLISACWDDDMNNRPTMASVVKSLQVEIALDAEASKRVGNVLERVNSLTLKPAARGVKKMNSWTTKRLSSSFSTKSESGSVESGSIENPKNDIFTKEDIEDLITPKRPNLFFEQDANLMDRLRNKLLVKPQTSQVTEYPEEMNEMYEELEYEVDLGILASPAQVLKMDRPKYTKRGCMSMLDFSLGMLDDTHMPPLDVTGHNSCPDLSGVLRAGIDVVDFEC